MQGMGKTKDTVAKQKKRDREREAEKEGSAKDGKDYGESVSKTEDKQGAGENKSVLEREGEKHS